MSCFWAMAIFLKSFEVLFWSLLFIIFNILISVFSLFDMDEVLRVPICTQPVCVGGTTCPTNFILLCVMHIQLDNKYYHTFALAFSTQSNFLLRQQFSLESICCKYISVHREGRNSRRSGRITNTSPHTAFN